MLALVGVAACALAIVAGFLGYMGVFHLVFQLGWGALVFAFMIKFGNGLGTGGPR